jgi:hypothetical protein
MTDHDQDWNWPRAYYHRVHEPEGDGWDVICTEQGRIAGGPGALSLDKQDAFLLAEAHDRNCGLLIKARAKYQQ